MQVFLSEFVPEVLRRVKFGTVRRLCDQPDVFRDFQAPGLVPPCAVNEHDDEVVTEIPRDLFQEDVHGLGVGQRKDQSGHLSQRHTYCRKYVEEDSDDLPRRLWSYPGRSPRRAMGADSAETPFILGHDCHWPGILWVSLRENFSYEFGEFFLKSSCTCCCDST